MEALSFNNNYVPITTINSPQPRPKSVDFFIESTNTVMEIFSVILLTLGYICNPISVVVLSRKTFRNTTMSVYLRFVAVCDTVTLTNGLVSMFRLSEIGRDIFTDLNICRLYYWTLNVFTKCSSWTLLAVTVERAISIARPHQVKAVCSVGTAKALIFLILLIWSSGLIFVPFMVGHLSFTVAHTNITHTRICVLAHGTVVTLFFKFFLDTAVYAIIPSVVLVVCNAIIIASVIQSRNRVLKISKANRNHNEDAPSEAWQGNKKCIENMKNKTTKKRRSKKETSMTFTLVGINTSYVVCNLPVILYQLYHNFLDETKITVRDNAIFMILFLIIYFNNILNFLFYFLTGSRFRQELANVFVDIIHCCKSKGS